MATHSSILTWRIPRTEESGGLQSMGFSRQGYWSGLPCPPPGDLTDPGIEPGSPESPALQADSLPLSHWGIHLHYYHPNLSDFHLLPGQPQ